MYFLIVAGLKEGKKKRSKVICRGYYCYKLQIRPSVLLHSGKLSQQYIVDVYIKVET